MFKSNKLAFKGANFTDFVGGNEEGGSGARPATAVGGPSSRLAKPSTRPGTAVVKPKQSMGAKKSTADESIALNENLAGVDDPIALSMQDRIKAGGLAS